MPYEAYRSADTLYGIFPYGRRGDGLRGCRSHREYRHYREDRDRRARWDRWYRGETQSHWHRAERERDREHR